MGKRNREVSKDVEPEYFVVSNHAHFNVVVGKLTVYMYARQDHSHMYCVYREEFECMWNNYYTILDNNVIAVTNYRGGVVIISELARFYYCV